MTSKKFSAKRPLTDDEEAEIQRMIASDPDNPELTDEQIAGLRPFAEVLPALAESARRGPGRPKLDQTLEPVTLRLDRAVVEHFRAQGADWRKRMARVLAKAASEPEENRPGLGRPWTSSTLPTLGSLNASPSHVI